MEGGGWKTVAGKKNAKVEKKERKTMSMSNATGAFADLDEFRKQQDLEKKQRTIEEAIAREARREEDEAKKVAAEDRKRRREMAEKARRAKDPRCWSVVSDVIVTNKSAMLTDMRALVHDDLANSTSAMKVQYVFTTFDKHCRSSTMPISEGIEQYFEPLNSVLDNAQSYDYVKTALDLHYSTESVSAEDYLVAASTTFGGKGAQNYHDTKNPTGLGLLLSFQYLVELNKVAALSAFPAMLRTIFINDKTAEFNSSTSFTNACSVLALAWSAPGAETGFHTAAMTSFLAYCFHARVQVPSALLDFFAKNAPKGDAELGEGDAAVTDTTSAFTYLLRLADKKGSSLETLVSLMNVISATSSKNKAYRNSFLPMLKEMGSSGSNTDSQNYQLALHLCKQFVLEDDEAGRTQAMWAESIATHVVESAALLQAVKSVGGVLHPAFVTKATTRLNSALQRSKNPENIQTTLNCLGSTKTGTSNVKLAQARKAGATSTTTAATASNKSGSSALPIIVGLLVVGSAAAYAAMVMQQQVK